MLQRRNEVLLMLETALCCPLVCSQILFSRRRSQCVELFELTGQLVSLALNLLQSSLQRFELR